MNRAALIDAFRRSDAVTRACVAALDSGAEFEVFEGTSDVADLIAIYGRRSRHVGAIGLPHGGFDQALTDLRVVSDERVRLGQVQDGHGLRHYQLFLASDADEVIACLWVHHES